MRRLTLALTLYLTLCLALSPITTNAGRMRGGARVRYSDSKHTYSHGGHYACGRGSSHKVGHYRNARTSNYYGRHK